MDFESNLAEDFRVINHWGRPEVWGTIKILQILSEEQTGFDGCFVLSISSNLPVFPTSPSYEPAAEVSFGGGWKEGEDHRGSTPVSGGGD